MYEIDIDTIQFCQHGDKAAFSKIFNMYWQKIYKLMRKYSSNAEDAADLSQEIFIKIYQKIHTFRCDSSFETWLYRVAVNTALNFTRRKDDTLSLDEVEGQRKGTLDPLLEVENKELSDKIQSAIAKLPDNLRITFVLVAVEGKSYTDTAQILELNIDAVRMRMARARKQLRSMLKPYLSKEE